MSKYKVGDKFIINIKEVLESEKGTLYRANYNTIAFDDYGLDGLQKYDALQERLELIDELKKVEYNQGMADAWELAQKIWSGKDSENVEIFGTKFVYEIYQLSPQEVLAKLKAYEEHGKVEVGDVVELYYEDGKPFKGVVLDFATDERATILDANSCVGEWDISGLEKTGKHINLDSILEQIGE